MVAQANVSSASGHQYQLVRAFVIGRVSCIYFAVWHSWPINLTVLQLPPILASFERAVEVKSDWVGLSNALVNARLMSLKARCNELCCDVFIPKSCSSATMWDDTTTRRPSNPEQIITAIYDGTRLPVIRVQPLGDLICGLFQSYQWFPTKAENRGAGWECRPQGDHSVRLWNKLSLTHDPGLSGKTRNRYQRRWSIWWHCRQDMERPM